ncbi:MAG: hypothetical protein ACLFSM_07860 [Thermoplasmata archaeon]
MKKSFWLLTSFVMVASSMIMPYIPIYGKGIGMSVTLADVLVFVFYGIDTIARIPIGSLSDARGYHKVIVGGGLSLLIASIFYNISDFFS